MYQPSTFREYRFLRSIADQLKGQVVSDKTKAPTTTQAKPPAERRMPDRELQLMARIDRMVAAVPHVVAQRVLEWLVDRRRVGSVGPSLPAEDINPDEVKQL